ncbi:MAG: hypothetical protein M1825_003613 [Sarcosagium campestre]|nr:MAG: hypothetical protein M1825_003613 [Sarcosagium campestre]
MPRLVRRRTLAQRIQAFLNPLDFLLWLSEEIESNDWDDFQRNNSIFIGLILNVVFLIARGNSSRTYIRFDDEDDVFGEVSLSSGWFRFLASLIVIALTLFSFANALYTFQREKIYRLFEASIDEPPNTPSARRVPVDSPLPSSSPLRFLYNMLPTETAESRSHADETRDVWELAVWDPMPICLRLFCLLSPGHCVIYLLFLPTHVHDPRPSMTVLTTIFLACLLSVQLLGMQASFSQQSKDTALIHKEVHHEYDKKFVHPRLNPIMRDVGIQSNASAPRMQNAGVSEVDAYPPRGVVHRGFRTNPNPAYGVGGQASTPGRGAAFPAQPHPQPTPGRGVTPSAQRYPNYRSTGADGGSLGVFTHARSPLRKTASAGVLRSAGVGPGRASGPYQPSKLSRV